MKLVKMRHDDPVATAGPTTADVPEDGVKEYERVGWYVSNDQEEEKTEHTEEGTKKSTKRKKSPSPPPNGDE